MVLIRQFHLLSPSSCGINSEVGVWSRHFSLGCCSPLCLHLSTFDKSKVRGSWCWEIESETCMIYQKNPGVFNLCLNCLNISSTGIFEIRWIYLGEHIRKPFAIEAFVHDAGCGFQMFVAPFCHANWMAAWWAELGLLSKGLSWDAMSLGIMDDDGSGLLL